jgi:membrane associated rhomboid family serine protease
VALRLLALENPDFEGAWKQQQQQTEEKKRLVSTSSQVTMRSSFALFLFLLLGTMCPSSVSVMAHRSPLQNLGIVTRPIQKAALSLQSPPINVKSISIAPRSIEYALVTQTITSLAEFCLLSCSDVIVVANALIWFAWQVGDTSWMFRHFVMHHKGTRCRQYGMLTSAFSHSDVAHLVGNMASLLTFAPKIEQRMGNRKFSFFYVTSIYASELFDALVYRPRFQKQGIISRVLDLKPGSLGASGAISALIGYYACSFPNDQFTLKDFSEEPIPAWTVALTMFLVDILALSGPNVGYGAHIGGFLFGASYVAINRLFGAEIKAIWFKVKYALKSPRQQFMARTWHVRRKLARWKWIIKSNAIHAFGSEMVQIAGDALPLYWRWFIYWNMVLKTEQRS